MNWTEIYEKKFQKPASCLTNLTGKNRFKIDGTETANKNQDITHTALLRTSSVYCLYNQSFCYVCQTCGKRGLSYIGKLNVTLQLTRKVF